MKKFTFSFKSLLIAAGLLIGSANAWGYDVPTGYEVKNVFIGTDNGDNTVTAEDYATTVATGWSLLSGATPDSNHGISIATITEVTKPEVGSAPEGVPTYVAGKCLALTERDRNSAIKYATFSFTTVSSGYLVFDADIFGDGNYPSYVRFVDSDGNAILTMHWKDGNTNAARAFQYQIGTENEVTTSLEGKPRTYHGYGIRDLVINLGTGATSFKLDYITYAEKRAISDAVELNIGTGKNIAAIQLGYAFNSGSSNVTQHSYMDNIKLYSVGTASSPHTYTVKAMAGSTELATLSSGSLKAGQGYSVTLNEVIEKSGKFYRLNDNTVTNYKKSYIMGDADENQTIQYVEDKDMVFYSELAGATYEETSTTASEGNVRAFNSSSNVTTDLDKGVYQILVKVTASRHSKSGSWRGFSMSLADVEFESQVGQSAAEHSFTLVVPEDDQTLKFYKGYNESDWIDYIIVRKIGDVLTSSENLEGYKTFYNATTNYEVDANTTIYKASTASSTVTLTAVGGNNIIKAGEAVILKTTNTTDYTIALTATETASTGDFDGNALTYKAEAGTVANAYVLGYVAGAGNGLGFYHYTASLPAGSIYVTAAGGGAKALRIVVDGEATGIAAPEVAEKAEEGVLYNLNGQVVTEDYKGIVIKNGKKFYNK